MKKVKFIITIVLVFIFLSSCGSKPKTDDECVSKVLHKELTFTEKIYTPSLEEEKIPGGYQVRITNNAPDSFLCYWLNFSGHELWNAKSITLSENDKIQCSLNEKLTLTFTEPMEPATLNVIAVKGDKASYQITTDRSFKVEKAGISISNDDGKIVSYNEPECTYWSLNSDMSDAKLIVNDAYLPAETWGKLVYLQLKGVIGEADSDVVKEDIKGPKIPSPDFIEEDFLGGKRIYLSVGNIPGLTFAEKKELEIKRKYNTSTYYVTLPEEIEVYYTIDGSEPSMSNGVLCQNGMIELKTSGNFTLKAKSFYKGVGSKVTEKKYMIEKLNTPNVKVEGRDVFVSAKDSVNDTYVYVFYGTDMNNFADESTSDDIRYSFYTFFVDDSYVGKSLYIVNKQYGYADSDPVELKINSLEQFQNDYSKTKTRQFGNWIVKSEVNARGKETGIFNLCGRFPMGADGTNYMIVVANLNNKAPYKVKALIFSKPSNGDLDTVSFLFDKPWSADYKISDKVCTVESDVYNINMYDYSATYCVKTDEKKNQDLLDKINSAELGRTVVKMSEGMSMLDALALASVAAQNTNTSVQNDVFDSVVGNLDEYSFILDNNGLKEALNYYTSLKK